MVLALALLYFGFNFLKGIDFFSTTNKYYAIYQNVDKLMQLVVSVILKFNKAEIALLLNWILIRISYSRIHQSPC
jgi:hypothetical protein